MKKKSWLSSITDNFNDMDPLSGCFMVLFALVIVIPVLIFLGFLWFKLSFGWKIAVIIIAVIAIIIIIEIRKTRNHGDVIQAEIIGSSSSKKAGSVLIRGTVGKKAFGTPGMLAGAFSAKNKGYTTFLLTREDGHKETQKVKNDTFLYHQYTALLK